MTENPQHIHNHIACRERDKEKDQSNKALASQVGAKAPPLISRVSILLSQYTDPVMPSM